jgi:FkbM family methyltransferase
MATLQKGIQIGKKIIPRGWSPLLRIMARISSKARMYPALLRNGDTLFVNLLENMCHGYFYFGEVYDEQYTDAFFRKFVKQGYTFIDVGANIGYYTRLTSNLVGKEGVVHAFEPMPSAFDLLKANAIDLSNVHVHQIAISDSDGSSFFSVNKFGETSSLGKNLNAKYVITVKQKSLDSLFLNVGRVDVIKIDVEGWELEVIKGAKELIAKYEPLLYFEYIDDYTRAKGYRLEDYKSVLSLMGYSLTWINQEYPNDALTSNNPSSRYIIGFPQNNRWKIPHTHLI